MNANYQLVIDNKLKICNACEYFKLSPISLKKEICILMGDYTPLNELMISAICPLNKWAFLNQLNVAVEIKK